VLSDCGTTSHRVSDFFSPRNEMWVSMKKMLAQA
jgi:hypothetical protein